MGISGRAGFQAHPKPGFAFPGVAARSGGEIRDEKGPRMARRGRKSRGESAEKEEKVAGGDPRGLENAEGRWELLLSMDSGDFGKP